MCWKTQQQRTVSQSLGVNHHHRVGIYTSKENALASSKMEVPGVQKAKQRTVLGVLTENEQHGRTLLVKLRPRPNYMSNHPEVTGSMHVVLVDWLAAVAEDYKLCTETLYLAASYLERFLSYTKLVTPAKLQLVGTKLLVRMELLFLKVLTINLTVPTTYQFLRLFFTIQPFCSKTTYLALYVAELSLLELEMAIMFPPSVVAASAYCLANYTLSRDLWPDSLEVFTGYTMVELVPCLKDLHRIYF
ncbi:hypothetical protein CRUP_021821, partial [Coryphaenoides rupestris]